MKQASPINPALCSKCFVNQGLKLDAERIGVEQDGACPHWSATDGRKLDKDLVETLAFRFFVRGTYHRTTYGGAPVVQMNEQHYRKTDLKVTRVFTARYRTARGSRADWVLLLRTTSLDGRRSRTAQGSAGRTTEGRRGATHPRCYPRLRFGREELFYRLRKAPKHPAAGHEYDSPPDSFLGTYRFDSPSLPILYASQDLEVCVHECRVTVEDDLYVATLRPKRDLQLLDLTEVVQDDATEFESLDIAVHMLFLAGAHSYEISRDIASAADAAGLDGIVYPSYFSVVRTGRMPIETAYGIPSDVLRVTRHTQKRRLFRTSRSLVDP